MHIVRLFASFVINLDTMGDIQKCVEESEKSRIDNVDKSTEIAPETTIQTSGDIAENVELKNSTGENNKQEQNTESNVSSTFSQENVHYEGDVAVYTDQASGYQYQWSKEKDEWEPRNSVQYGFEDDTHVYTDNEGAKYFWDKDKNAWFPKVDEDFMAHYQMSYGFSQPLPNPEVDEGNSTTNQKPQKPPKGEKRKASEPTWFEVNQSENTKVYVSNLPMDISEQEFVDFMQKCGLVMRDTNTAQFRVKLYKEPGSDILKGDALCTYIKVESVDLALKILDGADLKGKKVKVERAQFQMKGEYDPKLKPKMRKKKDKMKLKRQQEKLFDWRPEKILGERGKHEKTVIIKNLFDPSIFDKDVSLILEFQQDLREECAKSGEVRKIILYDRHPEGVAQINMSTPEEADDVITLMNGRWFMKRQLTAETWDGRTKYKIAETDSQISQRMEGWDKFLEEPASKQENNSDSSISKSEES